MKWVVLIARTLVGLVFVAFSLAFFFKLMPQPDDLSERVLAYMGVMGPTGYLTVVKVLELVGGVLLLTGRLAPVGITILTPIVVNILLFELLIADKPGIGIALTVLCGVLIYGYWPNFRAVFDPRARIAV